MPITARAPLPGWPGRSATTALPKRESLSEGLTLRGAKKPVGAMETTGARPAATVTVTSVIAALELIVLRTVRAKR